MNLVAMHVADLDFQKGRVGEVLFGAWRMLLIAIAQVWFSHDG